MLCHCACKHVRLSCVLNKLLTYLLTFQGCNDRQPRGLSALAELLVESWLDGKTILAFTPYSRTKIIRTTRTQPPNFLSRNRPQWSAAGNINTGVGIDLHRHCLAKANFILYTSPEANTATYRQGYSHNNSINLGTNSFFVVPRPIFSVELIFAWAIKIKRPECIITT